MQVFTHSKNPGLFIIRYGNFLPMTELRKFALLFLFVLLFAGCRAGIPVKTPQMGLEELESAFLQEKWDEVISVGEKRLQGEPDNVVVRFVMSMAYYMKGEYELQDQERSLAFEDEKGIDDIVAWCEQLAKRSPNNYYALLLLGSAYRAKDEVKALESYQRAVEINPNLSDAYVGLAATYWVSGKIDDAIKYFKKAIEINPKDVAAYFNLGILYENIEQIDEAIALYEKTIEIDPNFTDVYVTLGDLYSEKGEKDKAIKTYERVIELDPEGVLGTYAKGAIERIKELPDKDIEKKP